MRRGLYRGALFVFISTLLVYGVTLATVTYVGVYLTYVALPVIVISGGMAYFLEDRSSAPVDTAAKSREQRLREIDVRLKELGGGE